MYFSKTAHPRGNGRVERRIFLLDVLKERVIHNKKKTKHHLPSVLWLLPNGGIPKVLLHEIQCIIGDSLYEPA